MTSYLSSVKIRPSIVTPELPEYFAAAHKGYMVDIQIISYFLKGLFLSFSLIIAIGPQNAFVLKQGIKKQSPFLTALVTSCCDMVLIILGVFGIGQLLAGNPTLKLILTLGGIGFLSIYGIKSLFNMAKKQSLNINQEKMLHSQKKIVIQAIGFSWLNPHAILDTLVIIGSVSAQYTAVDAGWFGAGAVASSFIWFFCLAYISGKLSNYLRKDIVWKFLDFFIGLICIWLAIELVYTIL